MGRKIPAKKHRGVKDPLAQQAKRLESLKGKINAPPKDPDEQPVPRSLITLFGLEDKNKKKTNGIKKYKQHTNNAQCRGRNRGVGDNPVSRLRKAAGESGRDFSLRINSAIKALHNPANQLDYPHDIEAEDVKGQRMAEQRERRAKKRRRAARGGGAGGDAAPAAAHLTRTQKLSLKKKAKKMKALEASKEQQEVVYDRVSFGEVAHAPPALRPRSRPLAAAAAPRPGRRELLLTPLLARTPAPPAAAADLLRRERARLDAVAAYRDLKKSKLKDKNK